MPRVDLPCRCQQSPEQKTTNVCFSFIYADEHVVVASPPPHLSRLRCPAWLGRNLFQRSWLGRLMNSVIWSPEIRTPNKEMLVTLMLFKGSVLQTKITPTTTTTTSLWHRQAAGAPSSKVDNPYRTSGTSECVNLVRGRSGLCMSTSECGTPFVPLMKHLPRDFSLVLCRGWSVLQLLEWRKAKGLVSLGL